MSQFTIAWGPTQQIGLDGTGKLKFGKQDVRAGVFRFRVQGEDGVTGATFTGESRNIRHQMASYRNPGPEQLTNQRLGALLKTFCGTAGVTVLLEIVASARSKGNAINLESPGHRALLERALRGSSPGASLNL